MHVWRHQVWATSLMSIIRKQFTMETKKRAENVSKPDSENTSAQSGWCFNRSHRCTQTATMDCTMELSSVNDIGWNQRRLRFIVNPLTIYYAVFCALKSIVCIGRLGFWVNLVYSHAAHLSISNPTDLALHSTKAPRNCHLNVNMVGVCCTKAAFMSGVLANCDDCAHSRCCAWVPPPSLHS